jgi:hypothetical protein
VRLEQQLKQDMQQSTQTLPPIQAARSGQIHTCLDGADPATEDASLAAIVDSELSAIETALLGKIAAFGSVGVEAPVLSGYTDAKPTYRVGAAISPNKPAGDFVVGADGLEFRAAGLPTGLAIDATTGVITGTPTELSQGTISVSVQARNEGGTSAQCKLAVAVRVAGGYTLCPMSAAPRLSSGFAHSVPP